MTIVFLAFYGWGVGVVVREIAEGTRAAGIQRQAAGGAIDATLLAIGLLLAGLFASPTSPGYWPSSWSPGTIAQEVDQGTLYAIVQADCALAGGGGQVAGRRPHARGVRRDHVNRDRA